MPYALIQRGSGYVVRNMETGFEHSKKPISRRKAEAQMRLLEDIEKGMRGKKK